MSAPTPVDAVPERGSHFEVVGDAGRPTVVVMGGISASAHVASHPADQRPGWWEGVAGPGKALDPERYRVVGVDHTVPARGSITTHDQARVVAEVLDQLGVRQAHAIVGASYGGMVGLAFAELFPARVRQVVALCAAHESHPASTALRIIQRRILRLGRDGGRDREALALARCLGLVSYRSPEEFADRFAGPPRWDGGRPRYPVEGYLDHQADRFAERFSVRRYLALSESLDLHRVEPARITVPVVLVANRTDRIVPLAQVRDLARRLAGPARFHLLDAPTGHDAFLTEVEAVSRILVRTLQPEPRHAT